MWIASVGVVLNEGYLVYAAPFFSSRKQNYFIGGYLRFRITDYVGLLPVPGHQFKPCRLAMEAIRSRKQILKQAGFPLTASDKFLKWPERIMPFTAVTCCQVSK